MIRFLCFGLLFSASIGATTFKTQPIEQQIRESDGVLLGHYLRKKTIVLENGSLATQMHFKMTKENGLQSDLFGMDELIVHYPGGKTPERTVRIDGTPEFVSGEKVVIFIKNIDNRYWGMNLGFGTFKVINYGKETMLVNFIYPHDSQVGQVNFQHFEKRLKEIKGTSLKTVMTPQYPTESNTNTIVRAPASEGQNRSIASKSEGLDNEEDRPNLNVFWLIAALGFAGGIFRFTRKKSAK